MHPVSPRHSHTFMIVVSVVTKLHRKAKLILTRNYSLVNQPYCSVEVFPTQILFPPSTLASMLILCFYILVHLLLLSANTGQFVAKYMANLAKNKNKKNKTNQ